MDNDKGKSSKLEKFKLFYEHTADNRVILDKQSRPVKRLKRTIASRR